MAERIIEGYEYFLEKEPKERWYWVVYEEGEITTIGYRRPGNWVVESAKFRYKQIPNTPTFSTPMEAAQFVATHLIFDTYQELLKS